LQLFAGRSDEEMEKKVKYSSQIKNLRTNYVRFPLDLKPDVLQQFKEVCEKRGTKPTTEIKRFIREFCEEEK